MKRPLAIAAVLMLLAVIIATDWGLDSAGDDRDPQSSSAGAAGPATSERIGEAGGTALGDPQAPMPEGAPMEAGREDVNPAVRPAGGGALGSVGLNTSSRMTVFHFFRSRQILGTGEPTGRHRELLEAALATVLRSLGAGGFIFDADATSQFGSSVLVFARDEYDLT